MKKKILILLLTIVSILFITNQFYSENKNDYIRTIYVEDDNQLYTYLNEKYDLKNNENDIINIDESFSLEDNSIKSLSSNDNYVNINLLINKIDSNMKLEYEVFEDGNVITDLLNISVIVIDDDKYLVSRYDYIRLSDLDEFKNIKKCSAAGVSNRLLFANYCTKDGGSSPVSIVAGTIIGGAVAACAKNSFDYLIQKIFVGTPTNGVTTYTNTSTTSTTTATSTYTNDTTNTSSKINSKMFDFKLRQSAKDFLDKEENDYGWTDNELTEIFKKSLKIAAGGSELSIITELEKFDDKQRTICLGIYNDIVYDEISYNISYITAALDSFGSIVFSASFNWEEAQKKYTRDGMWLLNKYFLDYWIKRDCKFLLLTNPNPFYKPNWLEPNIPSIDEKVMDEDGNIDIVKKPIGYFYGKELKHININGYSWNSSNLSPTKIISCRIEANR